MPVDGRDVELVCGDWLGGAVISVTTLSGYAVYAVGKDGTERWRSDANGVRRGLAISTEGMVYLLSRSIDGAFVTVAGIDEQSGAKSFEHRLPVSLERYTNVRLQDGSFICSATEDSRIAPTEVSRLFVNMDGYAYPRRGLFAFEGCKARDSAAVRCFRADYLAGCVSSRRVTPRSVELLRRAWRATKPQ